jgi:hypothetical protein
MVPSVPQIDLEQCELFGFLGVMRETVTCSVEHCCSRKVLVNEFILPITCPDGIALG